MKKRTLYLLLGLFSVLVVITGIVILAPTINNANKRPASSADDGKMVFADRENEFCLGYLDNFKNESLTGSESPEEAERITRKNELIQEYKDYVGKLYGQTMTTEEYRSHYDHLMEMFQELFTFEPEPTPQEQLLSKVRILGSGLDDVLTFSKRDEEYRQLCSIDLPMLKTLITHLDTLEKQIENGEITYEQSLQEYDKCLEELKIASPRRYESVMNDDDDE